MDIVTLTIALAKAKDLIHKQIVSGSTDKGTWDALNNTPTLVQGTGHNGDYYHVSVAGTWDGITFNVADTILFDSTKTKWVRIATGNDSSDYPRVVKYVKNGDTFPATRTGGNPLVVGDTCCVDSSAVLPFTISGVTFDSYKDKAAWNGTIWQEDSYSVGTTSEIQLYSRVLESLSGESYNQASVNAENVVAVRSLQQDLSGKLSVYRSMPTPSSSYKDLIVLYAGADTTNYKSGRIYKCVEESTDIYKWVQISFNLDCDNVTIDKNSSGLIQLKDGGITLVKLNDGLRSEIFKATQDENGTITLESLI